ncbi:hypothetical protein KFK09_009794 [Dendrobium nobile]|uniref:Bidirectional sugar transporter SWEET n=1 Tax=Dendrobium nobile TaxID=94219 RepID=A0A8T3BIF5_DENNO|nr:hypothetical protein KFK09_009794 [Dendrobium nobile]
MLYGLPIVHPNSTLVLTINCAGAAIEICYVILYLVFSNGPKRFKAMLLFLGDLVFVAIVAVIVLIIFHTHERRSLVVGILCVIFCIIMYLAPLSVMKMVIQTKSVEYMPLSLSVASFLNGLCWTIYALIRFDLYITIPNVLGLLFSITQLVLQALYYKSTKRQIAERKLKGEVGLTDVVIDDSVKGWVIRNVCGGIRDTDRSGERTGMRVHGGERTQQVGIRSGILEVFLLDVDLFAAKERIESVMIDGVKRGSKRRFEGVIGGNCLKIPIIKSKKKLEGDKSTNMISAGTLRTIVGIIGNVIALGLFLSPLPTFIRIWKKKSVDEFSVIPYVATLLNCMLWMLYGLPIVHPNSTLVLTINCAGAAIEICYVILYLVFVAVVAVIVLIIFHTHERRSLVVGILCVIFCIIMYLAPLSVMKMVIQTKSVEYMPLSLSVASFLNGLCWTIYALIRFDLYITIPNVLGLLFSITQLVLQALYYKSTKRQIAERKLKGEVGLTDVVIDDSVKVSPIVSSPKIEEPTTNSE